VNRLARDREQFVSSRIKSVPLVALNVLPTLCNPGALAEALFSTIYHPASRHFLDKREQNCLTFYQLSTEQFVETSLPIVSKKWKVAVSTALGSLSQAWTACTMTNTMLPDPNLIGSTIQ
jgi:hypothetical protein